MVRRFLLVGLFSIVHAGSLLQLILATLFSLVYLVVQLQARPYKVLSDNYVALATSLSLVSLFFCCVILQTETLIEKPEVKAVLSSELQAKVLLPVEFLSAIILASIVGSLIFSSLLMAKDATAERLRQLQEVKLAKARRLRCLKTDQEIDAPKLGDGAYHLFLSQ